MLLEWRPPALTSKATWSSISHMRRSSGRDSARNELLSAIDGIKMATGKPAVNPIPFSNHVHCLQRRHPLSLSSALTLLSVDYWILLVLNQRHQITARLSIF